MMILTPPQGRLDPCDRATRYRPNIVNPLALGVDGENSEGGEEK